MASHFQDFLSVFPSLLQSKWSYQRQVGWCHSSAQNTSVVPALLRFKAKSEQAYSRLQGPTRSGFRLSPPSFSRCSTGPLALLQTHQATPALALLITWLEMLSLKVFPGLASSPHSVFSVWASLNILVAIARNRPPNIPLLPCLFPNISASNISHDLLVCYVYLFCLPG